MRYSQLRAFHSVARYGGFSRAAEAVFLTQPALSEHIRRLERDHDVLLFNRVRKRVKLTEVGKRLFLLTTQYFEIENQIEEFLSASRAEIEGTLRIIVDSASHVTDLLSRFQEKYPQVFVSLRVGNTEEVIEALRSYNAEVGVVGSVESSQDLTTINLGSTPIIACAARGFVPQHALPLGLADIARMRVIFREPGSKTRQEIVDEAARRGIELRPSIEVEGREAMREVVAAGLGIGFVSEAEFGHDARLERIMIGDVDLQMSETLVFMTQRGDLRIIRAFVEFARSEPAGSEA